MRTWRVVGRRVLSGSLLRLFERTLPSEIDVISSLSGIHARFYTSPKGTYEGQHHDDEIASLAGRDARTMNSEFLSGRLQALETIAEMLATVIDSLRQLEDLEGRSSIDLADEVR